MVMGSHLRKDCRLCGGSPLDQVLELTPTPPANEFLKSPSDSICQSRFPLGLWRCPSCEHVQLPMIVDPQRLFRNYVYVSGTSPVFVQHFREYADEVISEFKMSPGHLVVDVGSNDGTLLRFFKDAGMRVFGIDPARDIAKRATDSGIETLPAFLTDSSSEYVVRTHGRASVVTANNVFAHADDLRSVAMNVKRMLHPFGVFVFEVQYLMDMCDKTLFDMVYHEHLSYHHVTPLIPFFESIGMRLLGVKRIPTHGGSIRCYVDLCGRPVCPSVAACVKDEAASGFSSRESNPVIGMGDHIAMLRDELISRLKSIKAEGKRIAAYGAPAKATTLTHHFGIGRDVVEYVVDDNPLKHGTCLPGNGIPVVPSSRLDEDPPDFLLVLAWNFADSIVNKCSSFKERGGRFIIPLPEYREIP